MKRKKVFSVNHALRKIDTPSILFFLGILVAISALQSVGVLGALAGWLDRTVGNVTAIGIIIGFMSAVVDNVPLVAATQGMYSMEQYPADHYFWEFLAYCAGTGGSALIIGSAAGVAAMGMEKIDFFWYVRRITFGPCWAIWPGPGRMCCNINFSLRHEAVAKNCPDYRSAAFPAHFALEHV